MDKQLLINKTMDRDDLGMPECAEVVEELNTLMHLMQARKVQYSSWYGSLNLSYYNWFEKLNRGRYEPWIPNADDKNIPWFLLWEIAWAVSNLELKNRSVILDMGGASSLFSCYLAYKGHTVYSIDLNEELVKNGNCVAGKMGWDMKCSKMDMRNLLFDDDTFDHIFSLCVYEHIPISSRIVINRRIKRILRPGGMLCLTFDYMNPDKSANISSPESIYKQFVEPSGLDIHGNKEFHDNQKRYLESPHYLLGFSKNISYLSRTVSVLNGNLTLRSALKRRRAYYTFGAIFLRKSE